MRINASLPPIIVDDKPDPNILPFTARTGRGAGDGKEPPSDDESVEAGNAFAVARGTRSPLALRFLLPAGKSFAMPYAYHPIVWGESPELVLLEYPRFFSVILAGRNLGQLEARLTERRVTWIRQLDHAQAASLPAAVTRIQRLHRYPSRELDAATSDS